jgi:hypothetical protein
MPKAYWVICHRSTKAMAAYDTPAYKEALRALAGGAERDVRIAEGI